MTDLNDPTPEDLDEIRDILGAAGEPADAMTDDELVEAMRQRLEEKIPAPAPRAGSKPVNGRLWLHESLTAGGFRQPEDKRQLADLGDGGELVDLGILGIITMRHLSGSDEPDWSDERLAGELGAPIEHLHRGQVLLDEVAALVGKPATPYERWWER